MTSIELGPLCKVARSIDVIILYIDEGTSHGLERDSKVHGHVGGVGEDNGVRT